MKRKMIVPIRICHARAKVGLTQKEFAIQIRERIPSDRHLSTSIISAWETGRRRCPEKYAEAIATICGVTTAFLFAEEDIPQASISQRVEIESLSNYDGLPVFVEYNNFQRENGWGIVSVETSTVVFKDYIIDWNELSKQSVSIYEKADMYCVPNKELFHRKLELRHLLEAELVYIVMCSSDDTVKALYNGWYRHNETHTALINSEGCVLPYNGLGVSFMAYYNV